MDIAGLKQGEREIYLVDIPYKLFGCYNLRNIVIYSNDVCTVS